MKTSLDARRLRQMSVWPGVVLVTILVALLLVQSHAGAEQDGMRWISLQATSGAGERPVAVSIASCLESTSVEIDVPGLFVHDLAIAGTTCELLGIPGAGCLRVPGNPMVPEIVILVACPEFDAVQVSVGSLESEELDGIRVAPAPREVVKGGPEGGYVSEEYVLDSAVYAGDVFFPERIADMDHIGRIRDQKVVWLRVHPVQYNPVSRKILAHSRLRIELVFEGPSPSKAQGGTGPFEEICGRTVVGYREMSGRIPHGLLQSGGGNVVWASSLQACIDNCTDYLIVAADRFSSGDDSTTLDDFARFRADSSGYNVSVVPIGAVGSTDSTLKDFIQDLYESRSAAHWWDGHLGYVLLVGDHKDPNGQVLMPVHPMRSSWGPYTFASDNWFACVSGDTTHPAVMLGRISVDDGDELTAVTGKIMDYEPLPDDSTWTESVFLTAGIYNPDGCDEPGFVTKHFGVLSDIAGQAGFSVSVLRGDSTAYSGLRKRNSDSLATGRFLVHYAIHGGECSMGYTKPNSFTACSVESLSNYGKPCIFTSMSCKVANFDYDGWCAPCSTERYDCIAERLVNCSSGGAVAFIGATEWSSKSQSVMYEDIYRAILIDKAQTLGMAFSGMLIRYPSCYVGPINRMALLGDPAVRASYRASARAKWDLAVAGHAGEAPIYFDPPVDVVAIPDSTGLKAVIRNMSSVPLEIDGALPPVLVMFSIKASGDEWDSVGVDTLRAVGAWDSVLVEAPFRPYSYPVSTQCFRVSIDPYGQFDQDEAYRENNAAEISEDIGLWVSGDPLLLPASPSGDPVAALLRYPSGQWQYFVLFPCEDSRIYGRSGASGTLNFPFCAFDGPLHTPAVGDLADDGGSLAVIASQHKVSCADLLQMESLLLEWEKDLGADTLILQPPCVEDMAGTDELEIAIAAEFVEEGEGGIIRLDCNGDILSPVTSLGDTLPSCPLACADLSGDGKADIIVGTATSHLIGIDGTTGRRLMAVQVGDSHPVESIAVGDLDCDGSMEVVAASGKHLNVYRGDTTFSLLAAYDNFIGNPEFQGIIVADVADDADSPGLDIAGTYLQPAYERAIAQVWDYDAYSGTINPWWDRDLADEIGAGISRISKPVASDLHPNDGIEVAFLTTQAGSTTTLWVWDANTNDLVGFKDGVGDSVTALATGDFDRDGHTEMVWAPHGGNQIHVGVTPCGPTLLGWPMAMGDERGRNFFASTLADSFAAGTNRLWGRYLATKSVYLGEEDTLIIAPGTRILFSPWHSMSSLRLHGLVEAVGTADAPIVFSSARPVPRTADWNGVHVYCGDQGSSKFQDCIFEYADVGLMLHTNAEETAPQTPVSLLSCEFRCSDSYGVMAEGPTCCGYDIDTLRVRDCTFRNNSVGGLYLNDPRVHLDVSNSEFLRDTIDELLDPCMIYGIVVWNSGGCSLTENYVGDRAQPEPAVGSWYRGIDLQGCTQGEVAISRNCITHYVEAGISVRNVSRPIRIDSNYVQSDNADLAGAGLFFDQGLAYPPVTALVRRNVIRKNLNGVDVSSLPAPCFGAAGLFAGMNDLDDNVVQIQNWTSSTVMAESCWWGGVPADSMFRGPVDYDPYLASAPAGVSEGERAVGGPVYALTQSYPNPMHSGSARLRFSVPRRCDAQVEIFNVLGQSVRVLHSGKAEPGWCELRWDGTNQAGKCVSSGLYFCRLTTKDHRESIKIVVLR
jgi:hypothetical protein